jgi:hypothetical protein
MMIACHHPNFMPWPGLFFKGMQAEQLVLLDDVQFPLGGSWINRNRLKNDQGELWLRSFQRIDQVEICNDENWQKKHLFSLEHAYKHAPYWDEHFGFLQKICSKQRQNLVELNLEILDYLRLALEIPQPFVRSSTFAIETSGSQRLVDICKALGARQYLTIASSHKYLDENLFRRHGIQLRYYKFEPPIYPQLWGDFIANLSVLDLILTCGPKSAGLIHQAGRIVRS